MTEATMPAVVDVIAGALIKAEVEHEQTDDHSFVAELPGIHRLKTTCAITVEKHGVTVQAFVVRKPEENVDGVHAYLLARNARMYGVAWAIDDVGDIYLSGRFSHHAITEDEVDRLLGTVLEYADDSFNELLKLGFGESIRKEWAWRVKNGESLANLEAFADFATGETGLSAGRRSNPADSSNTPSNPAQN